MDKRRQIINKCYEGISEEERLVKDRQGQLEFFTTWTYIHKFLKPNMKILEIGAGTGRYSIELAKEGYDVTAIEYVNANLSVLKKNAKGLKNIHAFQGDAVDLSRFEDGSFDMVLNFGPMYHLYDKCDVNSAIDETIRVTKTGGITMFAFISVNSFLFTCYMNGMLIEGLEENFDKQFNTRHFTEQKFTGYQIDEFEKLFKNKNVKKLSLVSTDSILEIVGNRKDFNMSDEEFKAFKKYHIYMCERKEIQGYSSHLLYICKKIN